MLTHAHTCSHTLTHSHSMHGVAAQVSAMSYAADPASQHQAAFPAGRWLLLAATACPLSLLQSPPTNLSQTLGCGHCWPLPALELTPAGALSSFPMFFATLSIGGIDLLPCSLFPVTLSSPGFIFISLVLPIYSCLYVHHPTPEE